MIKRCCTTYFKDPFNLTEVLFFQNWHSTFISFKKWIISKESKALKIKYRFSSKQTNYIMGFEPGTSTVLAWRVNPKTNSADGKRDSCRVGSAPHSFAFGTQHSFAFFKERSVLFSNFLLLLKPKRKLRSFAFFWKECAFFQKNACSFLTLKKNATFFFAFFFRVKKELKCSFFKFFATYETQKNVAFFLKECAYFKKERTFFKRNACPTLDSWTKLKHR